MRLKFSKMHGAGNDFVVIDGVHQAIDFSPARWRALADRHFGIGADQMLLVEPSSQPGVDFRYRIFNADGGEVEQCGNGARCFVRFVHDRGLTSKRAIRVETLAGIIEPRLEDDGRVSVDMGPPRFGLDEVPFVPGDLVAEREGADCLWLLPVGAHTRRLSVLSMGNPHAVQVVADVDAAPVTGEGALIENHPAFPKRVNAGFMQVVSPHRIRLRVWERGAGETLACGTGACAAVVAGIRRGLLRAPVDVETRGGLLSISWEGGSVIMTGPATHVFEGEIELVDRA